MNIKFFFVFLSIFISSYTFAKSENLWSYSLGQFDANDSYDSYEQRIEYLYEKNLIESYKLMPFVGLMVNAESGKYFYTGLRKDFNLSSNWNITPSFAIGYYDRGSSKDLGHNVEFRSQIEVSYRTSNKNRMGISINHISNASIADQNPGTESIVLSFIRPF